MSHSCTSFNMHSLGEKKLQRVSVGVNKLVHNIDTAMAEVKESKGYKKLCVCFRQNIK